MSNPVQEYAWGSRSFIPEMLGKVSPAPNPQAEIWMGAHLKSPSRIESDGRWLSLADAIQKDPVGILGKRTARKFSNALPFLFKILAVERPLSVQVHPNQNQAVHGFERENRLGIPLNAPQRNYRDKNHKPELLCSLTPFQALVGFRRSDDILASFQRIGIRSLPGPLEALFEKTSHEGLKRSFSSLMSMNKKDRIQCIAEIIAFCEKTGSDPNCRCVLELHDEYPNDVGVLSPFLLNFVKLNPGEAIFLPPGVPHAYLKGAGVELMANSDNVIRGGLTPKHVDVPALLRVIDWDAKPSPILRPSPEKTGERFYPSSAVEFRLSTIKVDPQNTYQSSRLRSVEILFNVKGDARITDLTAGNRLLLSGGTSVIIPASAGPYRIEGTAEIYKTSVPF